MDKDKEIRKQLLSLLQGGNAHMGFDQAIADFPLDRINTHALDISYTPWRLLEHMRIAQWDILEFIRHPDHVSPEWPEGYWPSSEAQADESQWRETINQFQSDLHALEGIVRDPGTDLYAPFPQGEEYNVLREVLLVADHNAYHIGEFALLRQVMDTWSED